MDQNISVLNLPIKYKYSLGKLYVEQIPMSRELPPLFEIKIRAVKVESLLNQRGNNLIFVCVFFSDPQFILTTCYMADLQTVIRSII